MAVASDPVPAVVGDDGLDRAGYGEFAIVVAGLAAVGQKHRDHFGHVHAAAATKADDDVDVLALELFDAGNDARGGQLGLGFPVDPDGQLSALKARDQGLQLVRGCKPGVRAYEDAVTELCCDIGDGKTLLGPYHDIPRQPQDAEGCGTDARCMRTRHSD